MDRRNQKILTRTGNAIDNMPNETITDRRFGKIVPKRFVISYLLAKK